MHNSPYDAGITLNRAVNIVAPLLVNNLLKRHPSLMLAVVLADTAIQVRKCYKSKRKYGELILLSDFQ